MLFYISVGCLTFLPETDTNWAFFVFETKSHLYESVFISVTSFSLQHFILPFYEVWCWVVCVISYFVVSFLRFNLRVLYFVRWFCVCVGVCVLKLHQLPIYQIRQACSPIRHVQLLAVVLWFWLPTWFLPWGLWATDLAHHILIHF